MKSSVIYLVGLNFGMLQNIHKFGKTQPTKYSSYYDILQKHKNGKSY